MNLDDYFISEGCRLISKNGRHVTYIARCGHEYSCFLFNFKRGSSRMCRNCVYENMRRSDSDYHIQEGDSFLHISKLLENSLEVKRTNEGCFADFIYKPLGCQKDGWTQVQLKTTKKSIHGSYIFSLKRRYTGCIIFCHCVDENRFWIFRDYEVPGKTIGITSSGKYSKNEILVMNIPDTLKQLHETFPHTSFGNAMTPLSETQITEHQYKLKRERFFPHVQFEYPVHQHRKYDFIVNGKKYQEKVATINGNSYFFKSNQILGEVDFYFIHIPNTDYFYCIHEKAVVENRKASGWLTLNINKHQKWYAPYKHNYTRVSFSF